MKKTVFFVLMIIVAVTFVACDDSVKPEELYTTQERLVIKPVPEVETYMVFDLEKGYAIKSCKSYLFYDWTYSLFDVAEACKEMRSFPYVKNCSQSWKTIIVEYEESLYKGFTVQEIISAFTRQDGSVVYDRSWVR